ncbi:MAG: AAA family ATPase [Desulfobacter sp.]
MGYYRTLQLEKESFSNSPDPSLFYHSTQHLEVLQRLEIAIRLKRGLNIVTGDVGTGKTTICRQLIRKIAPDPDIQCVLILDPGFGSTTGFLSAIVKFLTGRSASGSDDAMLKEKIKSHLFSEGTTRRKTTVLLIDEGQKLSRGCLEILRELLNFETNNEKLLQIVIFAQKEFDPVVSSLDNFTDRINFRYVLSPLGFRETRGLIEFRLEKSARPGFRPPVFSRLAYAAIYRYTRGYPRKIINLCHDIILRLIIAEKQQAGYFFARACALDVFHPTNKARIGLLPLVLSACIAAAALWFFDVPGIMRTAIEKAGQVRRIAVNRSLTPDTERPGKIVPVVLFADPGLPRHPVPQNTLPKDRLEDAPDLPPDAPGNGGKK